MGGSLMDDMQGLVDKMQSMQRVVLERELDVQRQLDYLNERLIVVEQQIAHVPQQVK